MKRSLLAETLYFLRGRPDHPIYRRELQGWSYLRAWRTARRGCLPIIGAILVLTVGCCGLSLLPLVSTSPAELLWLIPGAVIYGIFIGGEIVNALTGLVATGLTATTISAEIEAQSYAMLRLTPIPIREVVLAKFSASVRQVRAPVIAVMVTRLSTLILGVLYVVIISLVGLSDPALSGGQAPVGGPPALSVELLALLVGLAPILSQGVLIAASLCVAGLIGLAYYLIQPLLDVLLLAAVGLFASSLARSRGTGILTAGAMRLGLWAASYVMGQVLSVAINLLMIVPLTLASAAPVWAETLMTTQPGSLMAATIGLSILGLVITIVGEIGLTLLLLFITDRRAANLPFAS